MKRAITISLLLHLLLIAPSFGATQGVSFGYEVVKVSSGTIKLRSRTYAPEPGMWLGVTFYPPQADKMAAHGVSQLIALKQGRMEIEIPVDSAMKQGSFEAAIWKRKTNRGECAPNDEQCQVQGYRLSEMKSYLWGYLAGPQ